MLRRRKNSTLLAPPEESAVRRERIAITGIGFVCPVGATAWEAALSMRKNRGRFLQHETVMVADDRFGTVLRGATVSRMPDDFVSPCSDGPERAAALITPAIRECVAGVSDTLLSKSFTRIDNLLVPEAPDFDKHLQPAFPDFSFQYPHEEDDIALTLPRCALFERIIQASEQLRQGPEQVAVVGCADSNVAVSRLERLLYAGRLMDASNPEGIIAGEAAGAALLETESHARKRNAPIYALIASWGRGTEPNPWTGTRPSIAKGLTDAFYEALAGLEDKGKSIGMVISDLNGARPRAMEWALTTGRAFADHEKEPFLSIPLFTIGDCGGASGAAILLNALSAFMFHRHGPRHIALTTSDDAGARRVICLERGDLADRRQLMDGVRRQLKTGEIGIPR